MTWDVGDLIAIPEVGAWSSTAAGTFQKFGVALILTSKTEHPRQMD